MKFYKFGKQYVPATDGFEFASIDEDNVVTEYRKNNKSSSIILQPALTLEEHKKLKKYKKSNIKKIQHVDPNKHKVTTPTHVEPTKHKQTTHDVDAISSIDGSQGYTLCSCGGGSYSHKCDICGAYLP